MRNILLRSPEGTHVLPGAWGRGFFISGSRIPAKANKPEVVASQRLTVVAAY